MLRIVFQDRHLVAVDKPAGLLVHRTGLDAGERRFAVQMLRRQIGRRVYPVHRLDKATSGVLLFALERELGATVSAMFASREVEKTYLAVVRGHPPESETIDHPLPGRIPDHPGREGVVQPAITRCRRLATAELPYPTDRHPTSRYALVQLEPITGRPHQLRRHMKHRSHPIVGDTTYGKGSHNRLFRTLFGCRRLLLACVELRLRHPVTGQPMVCTVPLAADFAGVLARLGWKVAVPATWWPQDGSP